jgi:AcrR family transcriptional regulator
MSAMEPSTTASSGTPGLRERKKLKTRHTIQREAFRLFAEHGYDATSVDQIAAAAEISPSTFFRYFSTKEDVVVSDEYDPMLAVALRARPADEPILDAIRHAINDLMNQMLAADREELLFRARLTYTVSALRARSLEEQLRSQHAIAALIAERTGRTPNDLELNCAAAMITAVSAVVVRHWVERDGVDDLAELFDRHIGLLSSGLQL